MRINIDCSLGQNGLRGYVDRIVQNAEQQNADRAAIRPPGGSSMTISRTIVNTMGSNPGYSRPPGAGGISALVNQPNRSTNSYQTISSGIRSTFRDSTGSDN